MKTFRITVLSFLLLALALPVTAYASGLEDGRVVIGGAYTLESGQVLSGDLVVIGGSGTLQADSRVAGDVALIGGFLNADGEIDGDVFALGGIVTLGPTLVIHGDLITIGAVVNRAEGALVEGQVTEDTFEHGFDIIIPGLILPSGVTRLEAPQMDWRWTPLSLLAGVGWSIVKALVMAGLAVLVVMFWPERTARVARTATAQPVVAFLIGLVTAIFGVTLIVVLAITICLSPISLIGALVLAAAVILGWVGLGLAVGWRMAQAFRQDWHPATQAGLGTLLVSLVVYAVGLIPCLGFFFGMILWLLGMGAAIMTRFGGQDSPAQTNVQAA
jgi:hypothetical protein